MSVGASSTPLLCHTYDRGRVRGRGRDRVRVPMLEGVVDAAPPHAEECARL